MREADQSTAEVLEFCCGEERWDEELNDYIRSGKALRHGRRNKQATLLWCRDGGSGSILGYACIVSRFFDNNPSAPSLLITYFAVDRKHHRQGHGKAMLAEIVRIAADGGAKVIELFVHEANHPAIAMYRTAGFEFLPGQVYVDPETRDRYPAMVRGV
jgi:ribosomal protein S18 acetylase RimI-like enzyme